jgi:TRAP-type C4-dicarboxylate transport system permease large subunit
MEIYWLTRLDDIRTMFIGFVIFGILFTIGFTIGYFAYKCDNCNDSEEELSTLSKIRKFAIVSFAFLIFGTIGLIFTPTTKQGLLIYGIKETVEYLDEHPTIKQLPEKAAQALDAYLDEQINESKENEE